VEAYCQYLAGLWHIFGAIEAQSLKAGEPVSQLDDVNLHRREAGATRKGCLSFELCCDQVKGMVELFKLKVERSWILQPGCCDGIGLVCFFPADRR